MDGEVDGEVDGWVTRRTHRLGKHDKDTHTGMCGNTKRDRTRHHKARQTQHFKTPPRAPLDKKCVEKAAAMCVCVCHVCVSCVYACGGVPSASESSSSVVP